MSRNKKEMNDEYPELVTALTKQKADNFIIDGEIVALKKGLSSFELLQQRINLRTQESVKVKEKQIPVLYRIFDLVYVDGYDIRELPILARKTILKNSSYLIKSLPIVSIGLPMDSNISKRLVLFIGKASLQKRLIARMSEFVRPTGLNSNAQ